MKAAGYESFYLRAVSPSEPVGVWIRYTVHKRAGQPPLGSVWCTVFDAARGRPFMHKLTTPALGGAARGAGSRSAPASSAPASGPGAAAGSCGPASWELRFRRRRPRTSPPPARVALPHEAAAHQAHEPGPRRRLRGSARAGRRAPHRARRLAWNGRAQLGLRARRALDLDARDRLRRVTARRGWTWPSGGSGSRAG